MHVLLRISIICFFLLSSSAHAENMGKWKQFEVVLNNPTFSNNPFDMDLKAEFTHTPSGRKLMQLGFYADNNTWKIYFMPDALGEWTYTTISPDSDLNGKSGSFICVASGLPGLLTWGEGSDKNRWRFVDKGYCIPMALATDFRFIGSSISGVTPYFEWGKNTVGASLLEFTGVHKASPNPYDVYGDDFNVDFWNKLNEKMDVLRDNYNMGIHFRFYSDDEHSPNAMGISAQSEREMRLFRYAVARLSAYPMVFWNTGVDIAEYRSTSWAAWFCTTIKGLDPYDHPVSNRHGGGSGSSLPSTATFDSRGDNYELGRSAVKSAWQGSDIPVSFDDRWREDGSFGWTEPKLRRATWSLATGGGMPFILGGSGYSIDYDGNFAGDLAVDKAVGYAMDFWNNRLSAPQNLDPHDELISGSNIFCAADPGKEYVVYVGSAGSVSLNLSGAAGTFKVEWMNPVTNQYQAGSDISGGSSVNFTAPWSEAVLHVFKEGTTLQDKGTVPIKENNVINVQPNPFHGSSCINLFGFDNSHWVGAYLHVYNSTGQLVDDLTPVMKFKNKSRNMSIGWNAGHLPTGIYFIKVKSGNIKTTKKIIIHQ